MLDAALKEQLVEVSEAARNLHKQGVIVRWESIHDLMSLSERLIAQCTRWRAAAILGWTALIVTILMRWGL